MNPRLETALKALLLLGTGYFLFSRIAGGTLAFYINERFSTYTVFAVIGLLIVALSYPLYRRTTAQTHAPHDHDADHQHADAHAHSHDHSHDHGHDHGLTWTGTFIISLPILLGLLVSPRPLGAAAMASREVNVVSTQRSAMPAAVQAAAAKASTERNVLDWSQSFQTVENPAAHFAGQDADVIGFVYRDDRFGADEFFLTRFVVSCCVADAAVAGVMVRVPSETALEADQWVRITGTFAPGTFDGAAVPVLVADSIAPADIPEQPYLYP
jgi:putative membrane protein